MTDTLTLAELPTPIIQLNLGEGNVAYHQIQIAIVVQACQENGMGQSNVTAAGTAVVTDSVQAETGRIRAAR